MNFIDVFPPRSFSLLLVSLVWSMSLFCINAAEVSPLVPVTFDQKPIPEHRYAFRGDQKFAVHTPEGEAIVFRLKVEESPQSVEVAVSDFQESQVTTKYFETGEHEVEIPVPTVGTYFVKITGGDTLWSLVIPKQVSAVLCLEEGHSMKHQGGLHRRYFYVPQGVREVRFTAETGHRTYKLDVLDPSEEVVRTFTEEEPPTAITIPEGMDGQVWSFNGEWFSPTVLFFENIPNYLSVRPNALLLPKDLVEKDGL